MIRRDYYANGGWETFLEYGDPEQDILIGLLRLRKCSKQRYSFSLVILSTLTVVFLENSSTPSSQAYTNLDTLSGRLTDHHSRTLHMVYPKFSRAILVTTL